MGYRSDVALGIAFPNSEALIAFASAQRVTGDKYMQEALKEYRVTHMSSGFGEGVVLWAKFEGVKWYSDYEDVKAHQRIMENARLLEYSTVEIEIGEEINDVRFEVNQGEKSDEGMLYECFSVSRQITQPNTSEDITSFVKEN